MEGIPQKYKYYSLMIHERQQQSYQEPKKPIGEQVNFFKTEVFAILQVATREVIRNGHEKEILFYSDSVALKAILRPRASLALVE